MIKPEQKNGLSGPSSLMIGWAIFFFTLISGSVSADVELTHPNPKISIIIDDLGGHRSSGLRAIALPGPITYAFLPHTRYSAMLANRAYDEGKEVMLHLPMQSMVSKALGAGGLTLDMTKDDFVRTVRDSIDSIPHVAGINNHMGSLLTRHPGHMLWLMEEINRQGDLFFIDSRTTHHTVAEQVAQENGVPVQRRDVFLDDDPSPEAVATQFNQLIKKAKREGMAIGIGHPYDSTLSLLELMIPQLEEIGIQLLPVSELFKSRTSPVIRMAETPAEHDHLVFYSESTQTPKTAKD